MTKLGLTAPWSWIKKSLDGVTAMWSTKVDPRALAICRIILFWHAAHEISPIEYARYMEVGALAWKPHGYFRAWGVTPPDPETARLLCIAYGIACLFAAFGGLYRVSALLAAGLSLYLHGILQNFGKALHTYHVFSMALVIMAFARAADAWSVDAIVRRWFLAKKHGAPAPPVAPSAEYRWPVLFVGSTVLVMYGAAGASKLYLTGWSWALSDTFRQTILQGYFDANPPTKLGLWLVENPTLCKTAALAALLVEVLAWLALLNRYLYWVWAYAVMSLQFGIWVLIGVQFGELPTIFTFFIPWDRAIPLLDRLSRRVLGLIRART